MCKIFKWLLRKQQKNFRGLLYFAAPCIIILMHIFRGLQKRTMGSHYLSVCIAIFAWWSIVLLWCCQHNTGCIKTSACFQTTMSMVAFCWQIR